MTRSRRPKPMIEIPCLKNVQVSMCLQYSTERCYAPNAGVCRNYVRLCSTGKRIPINVPIERDNLMLTGVCSVRPVAPDRLLAR